MKKYFEAIKWLYYNYLTIFNFFCITYILFILLFSGYVSLASEAFLTLSIIQLFTLGASSNLRNIYIADTSVISFDKIISLRILIGIISFIISCILIFYFISRANFVFHASIVLLAVVSWIIEIILAKKQLEKKINKLFLSSTICFSIIAPITIITQPINILIILIFFYTSLNILIFNKYIFQKPNFIINSFKNNIKKFQLGISSTFLKYFSNFTWRYLTFILVGEYKAGLLFVAFSLGSFLGTLFDVSYGAFFSKSFNKNKQKLLNLFIFVYVVSAIILLYFAKLYSNILPNDLNYILIAFIPSIIGGIITIHTLKMRQKLFETKRFHKKCFQIDILGYLMIIILIPALFYMKEIYVVYAYLLSSSFTYLLYKLLSNVIIKNYK